MLHKVAAFFGWRWFWLCISSFLNLVNGTCVRSQNVFSSPVRSRIHPTKLSFLCYRPFLAVSRGFCAAFFFRTSRFVTVGAGRRPFGTANVCTWQRPPGKSAGGPWWWRKPKGMMGEISKRAAPLIPLYIHIPLVIEYIYIQGGAPKR